MTRGIPPPCHAPDCNNFRSDTANRWVLAELKRHAPPRPLTGRPPPLTLVDLPDRAWTKPAPRRSHVGRHTYRPQQIRHHLALRAVCALLPFIVPLARRVF